MSLICRKKKKKKKKTVYQAATHRIRFPVGTSRPQRTVGFEAHEIVILVLVSRMPISGYTSHITAIRLILLQ